jgi:sn-glycerol 3-phosphate transport system substrate-binding protein
MPNHPRPVLRIGLPFLLVFALLAGACSGDDADDATSATTAAGGGGSTTSVLDEEAAAEQEEENQEALASAECPVDALAEAEGTVEIEFWHAMNAELGTTIEALAAEYNDSQDAVEVTLVNQNQYTENFDKYRTASSEDRPNLVQLEETAVQVMIDSGTAIPVAACAEAAGYTFEDYIPRVVRAFSVGDVLWPMPFNTSNPVLYYDANAFVAAGLDPDAPPRTLEELRAAAEALVTSGAATGGLSFDSGPSSGIWIWEQLLAKQDLPLADNGNGRSGLASAVVWDTEEAVEIVTWFRDMVADGLAVHTGRNDSADANFLAFLGERPVAMALNTSAALSSVLAQIPVLAPDIDLRVAPLPGLSSPDAGGVMVGGAALWLVADKPDEEIAAAWDFLTWLNEPEQQATWSLGTGYLPIRQSAAELPAVAARWAEQPAFAVSYEQLVAGNETVASAGAVLGPHVQIRELLATGLDQVLLEGADPATMIAAVAEEADAALADYAERTGRG